MTLPPDKAPRVERYLDTGHTPQSTAHRQQQQAPGRFQPVIFETILPFIYIHVDDGAKSTSISLSNPVNKEAVTFSAMQEVSDAPRK